MTDQPGESQVEFIDALQDAYIRLACFQAVRPLDAGSCSAGIENAKVLYNWIMGFDELDEADDTVELATESAPTCTRKH